MRLALAGATAATSAAPRARGATSRDRATASRWSRALGSSRRTASRASCWSALPRWPANAARTVRRSGSERSLSAAAFSRTRTRSFSVGSAVRSDSWLRADTREGAHRPAPRRPRMNEPDTAIPVLRSLKLFVVSLYRDQASRRIAGQIRKQLSMIRSLCRSTGNGVRSPNRPTTRPSDDEIRVGGKDVEVRPGNCQITQASEPGR